jgi:formaldehyde-activating enzyme involved in methanogenesis
MALQQSSGGDQPIVLFDNEFEDVPLAEVIDLQNQQQRLNGDAQASAAQTPARKTVKDFFPKISTDDHIKIQDSMMEIDVMDLRSIRTYRRPSVTKRRVENADDEEDDDEADAAEGNGNFS